jgi:hypothetical protein
LVDCVLDEISIYSRVLTTSEIIALSQVDEAPVALANSFAVAEDDTAVLGVIGNDTWVGREEDLTVQVWNGSIWTNTVATAHGTATVRSDKAIDFAADEVSEDEADSFDYRITDANGTSAAATVSLTIENAAGGGGDPGGGTLVYEWAPKQSWITGQSLAARGPSSVHDINKWNSNANSGATVGGSLVKSMIIGGPQKNYYWNNAPTGEPALEMWSAPPGHADYPGGGSSIVNVAIQLWNSLSVSGGDKPRHIRIVFEIKTCRTGDPTTFKSAGKGTTGGSYPNWRNTFCHPTTGTRAAIKYFLGAFFGSSPGGGGNANWWGDPTLSVQNFSIRLQPSAAAPGTGPNPGNSLKCYGYHFDRPGVFGFGTPVSVGIETVGVLGVWHRVEIEIKLTTPALAVSANARRRNPPLEPAHIGDGYVRTFVTKDLENELGSGPSARIDAGATTGMIFSPFIDDVGTQDNMHTLCTAGGIHLSFIYGGSTGGQGEGWSWIRKIQVYKHD